MTKITKSFVDSLCPPKGQKEAVFFDSRLSGFGIRVRESGSKTYLAQYRNEYGVVRKYTIGKHGSPWTPEEARKEARGILRMVALGMDPAEKKSEKRSDVTVADLAEKYLEEGPLFKPQKKATSWKTDRSNITRHIVPLLGKKRIKALTKYDIAAFQQDVAIGKSAQTIKTKARGKARVTGGKGTARRSLAVLAAMLAFAREQGMIKYNPAQDVKPFKIESRQRFLSPNEVKRLGQALDEAEERGVNKYALDAIRLLLLTGARKSEILNLEWSWVDLERGYLNLPDSKTGKRSIALNSEAMSLLVAVADYSKGKVSNNKHSSGNMLTCGDIKKYVFPNNTGTGPISGVQKIWADVKAPAGLEDVRLHDLRHSFASFAIAAGTSLFIVGKMLGHRQARSTEVYAHLGDDPLRHAAEATASVISQNLCHPKANKGDELDTQPDRPSAISHPASTSPV